MIDHAAEHRIPLDEHARSLHLVYLSILAREQIADAQATPRIDVTTVRTTPLSHNDEEAIRSWAEVTSSRMGRYGGESRGRSGGVVNLPRPVETFIAGALASADSLLPRRMAFARCALLRLGQWALDCRDFSAPRRRRLAQRLPVLVDEMLAGLRELVEVCEGAGSARWPSPARRRAPTPATW